MKWLIPVATISALFAFEDTSSFFAYGYTEPEKKVVKPYYRQVAHVDVSPEEKPFSSLTTTEQINELKKAVDEMMQKNTLGNQGLSTATATPTVLGREWFATTDVLYWHSHLEGTEYAIRRTNDTFGNTTQSLDFDWNFGFRMGVGTVVKKDRWDLFLDFTYFRTRAEGNARNHSRSVIVPLWTTNNDAANYQSAKSSLSLEYYNLDLELGRSYYISSQLALRPHFGVRNAWIDEKQTSRFMQPNGEFSALNSTNTERMWGIGPRLGIDGKWFLNNHFHFISNVGVSFLYSYFQLRQKDDLFASSPTTTLFKEKKHRYVPSADVFLGMGWGQYLNDKRQYVSIEAGYDLQYFWSQNQMIRLFPRSGNGLYQYTNANNDLSLSGFTLRARLDF